MAIKDKAAYKVYLDKEDTEYIKSFLETTRGTGGLSAVLNKLVVVMASTLRESGAGEPGATMNWAKMIRMVLIGLTKEI